MSDKQLEKRRGQFECAPRAVRCPKDGEKLFEEQMPYVVCAKCSTRYLIAINAGWVTFHWKLVEIPTNQKSVEKEKTVITKEVLMIPCKYCRGFDAEYFHLLSKLLS